MAVEDLVEELTVDLSSVEDFEERIAREFAEIDQAFLDYICLINQGRIEATA